MVFRYYYTDKFVKEMNALSRFSKRLKQINKAIEEIIKDPFCCRLNKKKMINSKFFEIRYLVGRNYRIKVEIIEKENLIIFMKVGKRENFYSR